MKWMLILLAGGVYYGDADKARKPAEVVATRIFQSIPEYQEIQSRGLDKEDAEYWSLLVKANRRFYKAIKTVADDKGIDTVLEKGTRDLDDAPDITQEVINALSGTAWQRPPHEEFAETGRTP